MAGGEFRVKRVYEPAQDGDGKRVLVDRLWPRGLSKEKAAVDRWEQALAPSDALRRWFAHDAKKWPEFRRRYFAELDDEPEGLDALRAMRGRVTLLFAARDEEHNNAVALKEYLERQKR